MAIFSKQTGVLTAYMDESMTNENMPIMSVAGYLFEPEDYLEFDRSMVILLEENNLEYFRLSECLPGAGQFAMYEHDVEKRIEIETAVIQLIRKYAVLGMGVSASDATFQLMRPIESHQSLYNALCQWCLWEAGRWCDRNEFNGEIAYFFESGYADESATDRILRRIPSQDLIRERCRYSSHTFVEKKKFRGLQAADTLAWFARREAEDTETARRGAQPRKRRQDFQALIGNTQDELKCIEHKYRHLTSEALAEYFRENSFGATRWY